MMDQDVKRIGGGAGPESNDRSARLGGAMGASPGHTFQYWVQRRRRQRRGRGPEPGLKAFNQIYYYCLFFGRHDLHQMIRAAQKLQR